MVPVRSIVTTNTPTRRPLIKRLAKLCLRWIGACANAGDRRMMMDRGMHQWMMKEAHRNRFMWAASHDWQDIVQESHACLAKLAKLYPDRPVKVQMALFKKAFHWRLCDIGRKNSTALNVLRECDLTGEFTLTDLIDASTYTHPDISDRLALIAEPIRRALYALAEDPRAMVSFLWIDGAWETPNGKLCRLAGLKNTVPLLDMVKSFLLGDEPDPLLLRMAMIGPDPHAAT